MASRRGFLATLITLIFAPLGKILESFIGSFAPPIVKFDKIRIPMIRRTFPELLARELVDIQPMSGLVGMSFAIKYVNVDKYK